jgi:hypothetical protein
MNAVLENDVVEEINVNAITFLNMSGDITLTWSKENDEKIKALVRKKMAEGYSFFTMRKVIIESIQIKRKIGLKGIDTIKSIIVDDKTFDKMIEEMNDKDLAETLRDGAGNLAKRAGGIKKLEAVERLKSPEDVMKAKQAVAVRPIRGG